MDVKTRKISYRAGGNPPTRVARIYYTDTDEIIAYMPVGMIPDLSLINIIEEEYFDTGRTKPYTRTDVRRIMKRHRIPYRHERHAKSGESDR